MLNRTLSLVVAAVAPASSAAMLIAGAHPIGAVSWAERGSCIGLALIALALAIGHHRAAATRPTRAEAAMWSGLAIFFCVATFASPRLGAWAVAIALVLAATSALRLVAAAGAPVQRARGPIRRRLFA